MMWNQFLLEMTQFYSWVVFVVKWEMPKVIGKNLDLDKGTIQIDKKEVSIGGDMLYHAYNTLASITFLREIKLPLDKIIASINNHNHNLNFEFVKNNKLYKALNCKAENATTYNECVYKVYLDKEPKDIKRMDERLFKASIMKLKEEI